MLGALDSVSWLSYSSSGCPARRVEEGETTATSMLPDDPAEPHRAAGPAVAPVKRHALPCGKGDAEA